jgi:3-phosphoinositide dependent protein kinase-1
MIDSLQESVAQSQSDERGSPPTPEIQEPSPSPAPPPSSGGVCQKRLNDFNVGEVLGQGAFGQVQKVIDKEDGKQYAMKVLSKSHIMREKKMPYVRVERDVMSKCRHPNIIRLILTFQDTENLYYVTELAPHGDLQKVLNDRKTLNIETARVAVGQTLLAVAHMHQKRVLHRDLKPENLLLGTKWNVKVTGFGTAKIVDDSVPFGLQRGSFVGSADYVSPEVLGDAPVGPSADLWAVGCILFAFLVGTGPFRGETQFETFHKIQGLEYTFPPGMSADAQDLIRRLLRLDPAERLGHGEYAREYASIKEHPFFAGIDWGALPEREVPTLSKPVEVAPAPRPGREDPPAREERSGGETAVPGLLGADERSILEGTIKNVKLE